MVDKNRSDLIHVAALCQMLLDALERLDGDVASDALIAELREVCERAHAELERRTREA
jgi:hypothetical protein